MAIRVEDLGELAYGGLVTGAKFMDTNRIADGKLTNGEILKKFETYAYLVPGLGSVIASAFGMMKRQETWLEHISHGFMYGFPGWLTEVVQSMQAGGAGSAAVREAQRIINRTQLPAGKTARSYQPEFRRTVAW
ncbi:hypothetical protein KKF82_08970 [Patescibacteria group bacterium]|nr:hypothetical protein [Patescibacteria group bacterium]